MSWNLNTPGKQLPYHTFGCRIAAQKERRQFMTSSGVWATGGIAILAAVGFAGCSRQTEVAQPLYNPAPTTTSTYYDERSRSADIPTYSTVRSPVRTVTTQPAT